MPQYFYQFPIISYSNVACRDLTKRVQINASIKQNIDVYYPAEIDAGFRADALAEAYYDDAELDWLIYLMNDVVDPYYEWYNNTLDFNYLLRTKYDSIANSQERIVYYRNNWYEDDDQITPEAYENIINKDWKKYYEPIFTPTNSIYSYRRKQEDWVMNTNRIIQYRVYYSNSEVQFVNNEIIDIYYSGEIVGGGECILANSTHLVIQHVNGNTIANTTWTKDIVGETSGANATSNAYLILSENFTNAEARFWSNVTYYDIELEKYERRKNVQVINSDLIPDIVEEIRQVFRLSAANANVAANTARR